MINEKSERQSRVHSRKRKGFEESPSSTGQGAG